MQSRIQSLGVNKAMTCHVSGFATLRVSMEEMAQLRRNPGAVSGEKIAPTLLKNAEEHSVVGLAVVLRALLKLGTSPDMYRDWGVVAAPIMFGRDATNLALERFKAEGAWGISPHMIPHYSLHAVSGTISQALKIHGANFGVSGGPSAAPEGFLVAASLLAEGSLPGLWLVVTGYDREKIPNSLHRDGESPLHCEGVALALEKENPSSPKLKVYLLTHPSESRSYPDFSLSEFLKALDQDGPQTFRWGLPGVGLLEWEPSERR